jgi:TetR/AcrR family transcriptional regulator
MPRTSSRPRAVGRPRADRRPRARPPEEEILFQAARLFGRQGVAATTTRQIAAAAGLRQPSLFHWFPTKDAIVEALLESSIGATLAYAERVAREPQPAALRLFRVLRFDARHLCASPYDLTAVVLSPESWVRRYERFWKRRDRLIEIVGELIAAGMREGALVEIDRALATRIVFGMDEGVLTWFERGGHWSPDAVGDALAGLALRALLRDPKELAALRRATGPLADERP